MKIICTENEEEWMKNLMVESETCVLKCHYGVSVDTFPTDVKRICRKCIEENVEFEREEAKWIPCNVKMPKPDEFVDNVRKYYLVQNEYGDMCVASYTNRSWRPINALYVLEDIVAWRQLPELYKAEAEEPSCKYVVEVCNKFHNYREQIGVFSTYDEAKAFADKKDFDFDESSEYVEITEVEGGNV